jgi:hypothetical protein
LQEVGRVLPAEDCLSSSRCEQTLAVWGSHRFAVAGERIDFAAAVPDEGPYYLFARVFGLSDRANSFFFLPPSKQKEIFHFPGESRWLIRPVSPEPLEPSGGHIRFGLATREPDSWVDELYLVKSGDLDEFRRIAREYEQLDFGRSKGIARAAENPSPAADRRTDD